MTPGKLLEILGRLQQAQNKQTISDILWELVDALNFDYFWYTFISPRTIQRPLVIQLTGCPSVWTERYVIQRLITSDPVMQWAMKHDTPVCWSQFSPDDYPVMAIAQEVGLRDGLALPCHSASGHISILSLITHRSIEAHAYATALPILSSVLPYLVETSVRLINTPLPILSAREREVCQWAAEGKQASDIGRILGVSTRTITFHLSRIVEKLGASNKNQAMSWALKQGLVQLNVEAAPITNLDKPPPE
ncbi:helix-turn-helix transcriptional regulator [Aeromonas enteropelogenes]|uniref:helix-turn-helix transcriptional regulator n=1 Tax=Aeromonas enteropelogenes TaxID=29489 RepID=UPI003B9E6E56